MFGGSGSPRERRRHQPGRSLTSPSFSNQLGNGLDVRLGLLQHLRCGGPCAFRDLHAADHAGNLLQSLLLVEPMNFAAGPVVDHLLFDLKVCVAKCRDLGQVCNAKYLMMASNVTQLSSDDFSHGATNARIDFIEHIQTGRFESSKHPFDGQKRATEFSSARDFGKWTRFLTTVGRNQEFRAINACGRKTTAFYFKFFTAPALVVAASNENQVARSSSAF